MIQSYRKQSGKGIPRLLDLVHDEEARNVSGLTAVKAAFHYPATINPWGMPWGFFMHKPATHIDEICCTVPTPLQSRNYSTRGALSVKKGGLYPTIQPHSSEYCEPPCPQCPDTSW
jgi:hypothetical protein